MTLVATEQIKCVHTLSVRHDVKLQLPFGSYRCPCSAKSLMERYGVTCLTPFTCKSVSAHAVAPGKNRRRLAEVPARSSRRQVPPLITRHHKTFLKQVELHIPVVIPGFVYN